MVAENDALTHIQSQLETLLTSDRTFRALEAAQLIASQAPQLTEWARQRLPQIERRADLLDLALRLLDPQPDPDRPRRTPPPLYAVERGLGGEVAFDPQTPADLLRHAWYGIDNWKTRLSVTRRIAANHPELRPLFEQLAYQKYETPSPALFPQFTPVEERAEHCVRLDPELGRLAVGLNLAPLLRIWAIAQDQVRQRGGAGWLDRKALAPALSGTSRHIRRQLAEGDGLFWNLHSDRIYLCGLIKLAERLTARALEQNPDLVLTNRPGAQAVEISVSGSLAEWEARLYAAWLYHRNHPTIARATLTKLFARGADTLRRWEERIPIVVRRNDAQTAEHWQQAWNYLPSHARDYVARTQQGLVIRYRWQIPNSYVIPCGTLKMHPHCGQAHKVRKAVNHQVESYKAQPAETKRGGALRERLYFDDAERLERFARWCGAKRVRYLWRGENRHGHGVFEPSFRGEYETYADERAHPRAERQLLAGQLTLGFAR